jgi:hypothetical protein
MYGLYTYYSSYLEQMSAFYVNMFAITSFWLFFPNHVSQFRYGRSLFVASFVNWLAAPFRELVGTTFARSGPVPVQKGEPSNLHSLLHSRLGIEILANFVDRIVIRRLFNQARIDPCAPAARNMSQCFSLFTWEVTERVRRSLGEAGVWNSKS